MRALPLQKHEYGGPVQLAAIVLQARDAAQADTQPEGLADQLHPGNILGAVIPVAIDPRHGRQQASGFIQADGLGAGAGQPADLGNAHGLSP